MFPELDGFENLNFDPDLIVTVELIGSYTDGSL
jgi:hypothetical protein